MLLILVQ
jgi:hypothetical protein